MCATLIIMASFTIFFFITFESIYELKGTFARSIDIYRRFRRFPTKNRNIGQDVWLSADPMLRLLWCTCRNTFLSFRQLRHRPVTAVEPPRDRPFLNPSTLRDPAKLMRLPTRDGNFKTKNWSIHASIVFKYISRFSRLIANR